MDTMDLNEYVSTEGKAPQSSLDINPQGHDNSFTRCNASVMGPIADGSTTSFKLPNESSDVGSVVSLGTPDTRRAVRRRACKDPCRSCRKHHKRCDDAKPCQRCRNMRLPCLDGRRRGVQDCAGQFLPRSIPPYGLASHEGSFQAQAGAVTPPVCAPQASMNATQMPIPQAAPTTGFQYPHVHSRWYPAYAGGVDFSTYQQPPTSLRRSAPAYYWWPPRTGEMFTGVAPYEPFPRTMDGEDHFTAVPNQYDQYHQEFHDHLGHAANDLGSQFDATPAEAEVSRVEDVYSIARTDHDDATRLHPGEKEFQD
ncbi:hypothetical protein GY45DRAFT_561155 [Cubamyces sp. BRFM 1775]|nr:hypothetical protein GY45DRAFT_561155 [Cubamyces sp. BRFM 1775]